MGLSMMKKETIMQRDFFEGLAAEKDGALGELKKRFNQCAALRVGAAVGALVFLCLGIQSGKWLYYGFCVLFVLGFFLLVKWHQTIVDRQESLRAERETVHAYLDRMDGKWKGFADDGQDYLSPSFPQGRDLDVFGEASLFQYLACAHTAAGRDRLASLLREGAGDVESIRRHQQAVGELLEKWELALSFQSRGRRMAREKAEPRRTATQGFIETMKRAPERSGVLRILTWGMPLLTWFFGLSALLGIYRQVNLTVFMGLAAFQFVLALAAYGRHEKRLGPVYAFHRNMEPYREMLRLLEQADLESPLLLETQEKVRKNGGASKALAALERIGGAVEARHNGLAFFLYNSLLLWDFHCMDRLDAWQNAYGREVENWLLAVGEMEALISLTIPAVVRHTAVFPEIEVGTVPFLSCRGMDHPLMEESTAVDNDFQMNGRTCIITGSNMSGKTTFLRTVGLNLILSYAGAPVAAMAFRTIQMRVMTSMRVEDNVSQGISTFYAELLRIKDMVEESKRQTPMIALIDEIYKGTNSRDRITGARETVKRLTRPWVMTLLTTHDFELCDLEKDPEAGAVNLHFTETYEGDRILFDYKIHPGRCRTTNAWHLLRLVGIVEEEPS